MRERRLSIPAGPQAAAAGLLILWAGLLIFGRAQINAATPVGRAASGAALLWFLLNFIFWFVPSWRASGVERRGPLLGFGFAFAAALISAVVDGAHGGIGVGVSAFFARLVWLGLPFLLPFVVRPSPYPHLIDLGVALYALLLPHLPGFGGEWMRLAAAPASGFFGRAAEGAAVGAGHLAAVALVSTYFCGARPWTAAPLDWRLRPGDAKHALRCGAWAALAALLGWGVAALVAGGEASHPIDVREAGGAAALLFGVTVGSLFEGMFFCALLQSGIPRWLPKPAAQRFTKGSLSVVAALLAAFLHAWVGVYGLPPLAGAGFALGLALAYRGVNRMLPAVLGHAAALAAVSLLLAAAA